MSDKPKLQPQGGSGGRTPQPPTRAGGKSATQPRSRASTPTGAGEVAAAVSASPTASAIASAKSSGAARQSTTLSNNNSGSPRAITAIRKATNDDEPATDDDDATIRFLEFPKDEWLRQSQATLATMEKQVHDAAKRTLKHQNRCATMKESIAGKGERMDMLRGTYANLTRELDHLELLSGGDIDSDALEKMYNSIPSDDRAAALDHTE